jgi:hypothetical protein
VHEVVERHRPLPTASWQEPVVLPLRLEWGDIPEKSTEFF